jgi:hypothetical protein
MPATSTGMTSKLTGLSTATDKERASMRKPTVKYTKGEISRVKIVTDFLPPPDRLVLR